MSLSYDKYEHLNDIKNEVEDIVLNLVKSGRIEVNIMDNGTKPLVIFMLSNSINIEGFYFSEIQEYVFKIVNYLRCDYKSCSITIIDKLSKKLKYIKKELNLNDENIFKKMNNVIVENLIIEINLIN